MTPSSIPNPLGSHRRRARFLFAVVLVLLAGAIFLGFLSSSEMRRIVSEDFNAQQLALALHAAGTMEQNFRILKRELLTLSLSPSIQYVESVSWRNRMKISLSTVEDHGVFRIMLIQPDKDRYYSIDYNQAVYVDTLGDQFQDVLDWGRQSGNRNRIYMTDIRNEVVANSEPGLMMTLATPVYQISPDEAHPVPTHRFSGVLLFFVDAGSVARRHAGELQSGKTGYAWVIDGSGRFLYHLEHKFVGHNAFEVRKNRDPHISFAKINRVQKELMMAGKQGTTWYISGWHRGETGRMKKLIAYAPVHIGAGNSERNWSVAVVAPMDEVQTAVRAAYLRQALIQIAFLVAVAIAFYFIRSDERTWLRMLELEVERKTRDLEATAEKLRRSEERYRSLVESADDVILTVNRNGAVLTMNHAWTRLTGGNVEAVIDRNLLEIFRYPEPEAIPALIEEVLASRRTRTREELVVLGDREYWLHTSYTPISVGRSGGAPNAVLIIARDITETKKIETQLTNTVKMASLGALSAGVAHEINNPIAVILGFTEVLMDKIPPDAPEYEILKVIERQGQNCQRIVENLLVFARTPKGAERRADVVFGLQQVLNVVQNTLLTEKVTLESDIPEELPAAAGDVRELEQVFLNIINNAVAAMPEGGTLRIVARPVADGVTIEFSDTGAGISEDHLAHIFDPFFTTKEVGKGTGLGLSVSYGIVQKFGGEIRVTSRTAASGASPGTTFTVYLPLAPAEISAPATGEETDA